MFRTRRRWKTIPLHLQSLEDRTLPATFVINSTLDTAVSDGNLTLREAINSMNLGNNSGLSAAEKLQVTGAYGTADTILFSGLSGTITLGGTQLPAIAKPVTISGPGAGTLSISGNNASRIFQIGATAATSLSGLTLTKGKSVGFSGGAIYTSSNLTITDSVVTGNSASSFGGGISSYGLLTLVRTTLSSNTSATQGGGFFSRALAMSDCAVSGNYAVLRGGGLELNDPSAGSFVIRNSTLSGNTSPFGAAISLGYGLSNPFNTSVALQNCTITANAASSGGAVQLSFGTGTINIDSTIISGNSGSVNDITSASTVNVNFSAIGNSAGFTLSGANNLAFGANLKLGVLASNGGPTQTVLPATDSPVLDAGSNPAGLTTDQRGSGFPRVWNGQADIGAVELPPADFVVRNTNDTGKDSLRARINDANVTSGKQTITFGASFNSAKTITLTGGELAITDSVTIVGPGADLLTVSGNNASRVFNANPSGVTAVVDISNLTISGGLAKGGGGILADDVYLTLSNVTVKSNTSFLDGGGISLTGTKYGFLEVFHSTFTANKSINGGAIHYNEAGNWLRLYNSTLTGNTALNNGGGVYYSAKNTFSYDGSKIINCTIAGNSAGNGGGIFLYDFYATSINNSIVSDNTAITGPDISDISFLYGIYVSSSAIGSASGWVLDIGSGNLASGTDLKLGALASNGGPTKTMMPALDSPLRSKGSKDSIPFFILTDQRGLPRTDGIGNVDIGAVQVHPTSIVSITRNNPNPTIEATVAWTVKLADPINGLSLSNFSLSGSGAAGASLANCFGAGTTYTVGIFTGVDGDLTLNFVNSNGLNLSPVNLPYAGQSYAVDKLPLAVTSLTVNDSLLTDDDVGPSRFSIAATYSEAMNPAVIPAINFPVENPAGTLSLATASWTTPTTFTAVYNVNDLNVNLTNVDVKVTGGKDTGGNVFSSFTKADLFSIDTRNPIAVSILRDSASPTKAATVSWTVSFSEAISGLAKANFSLFNGGLTGIPAITNLTGVGSTYTVTASTGSGEGTLALYVDNGVGVTDANGNFLAGTPVVGGAYDIDHVSPAASILTLNTLTVSDTNVGPNGFTAALKYNELMDQTVNPTVSFPAEFPASLTPNGGVWLDARTYQAKFNVADLGVTQNDIDIRFTGGLDLVGNVQSQFDAVDVFDIDTQNPIVSSIVSNTADGTYSVGANIDITLNFSEPVNLIGTLNVTLDTGAVVSVVGPASGTSLNGTYTVAAGQNSPDLNVTAIALAGGGTLRDDAMNNSVLTLPVSNLANNTAIVVSTTAGVTGFIVNDGALQRSRLTKIIVNFASPVDAATLAPTLTRTAATGSGTVGTVVNSGNGLIVSPGAGMVTSVTLTFSNVQNAGVEFGSLTDGRWRLAIPSLGYQSALNDPILRRFFGDADANGTVDGGDLGGFGAAFGQTSANNPFDFNNDGTIDALDFGEFGNRFGLTL